MLSIIVPCYNEENQIVIFQNEIKAALEQPWHSLYEVIFVDDGSTDQTLREIKRVCATDHRLQFISFSRNFGKEAAMLAGMKAAQGAYIAIMDVDLQDPPALLPEMLDCLQDGEYDCVATRRVNRKGEPVIRSVFARLFYRVINKISNVEIVDGARDFRLMTRQMVEAILEMPERNRFSKGIFSWVGFRTSWLEYENRARVSGQTKWSFAKLFLYSLEGIFAFSTLPLAIASVIGILLCIASFAATLFFAYQKIFVGIAAEGWATMMCLILMLGGVQLFSIGILGQYLAKTYIETKQRPLYIVKSTSAKSCDLIKL